MRKQCLLVAGILVTVLGGAAGLVLRSGEREPVYQDRRLSDWLADFDRWDGTDTNAPVVLAIRALGTNAVPRLVQMSLWRDSRRKEMLGVEWEKYPRLMPYRYTIAARRWQRAGQALSVMGEPARAAVPYYLHALTNGDAVTRRIALNALGSIGPPAKSCLPALIARQNDQEVRANLLGALGDIGRRPDLCVPLLMQALEDTDAYVRQSAVYALGRFGAQAKAAVPGLTRALQDKHTAKPAASALKKIQSEEEMTTNSAGDPR